MTTVAAPVLAAIASGIVLPACSSATAPTAVACHVSTGRPLPGNPSFNYGNRRIAVALPRGATFVAVPEGRPGRAFLQSDGWIRAKVGWWTARGKPRITGRRTDQSASPLRADVGPLSRAGEQSFYPSLLYFSSTGCWRLTATAAGVQLIAVVKVVNQ